MEKQKNIPQLRFPDFVGEWGNLKLGELSKSIHSGKDSNVFDGNYPLYGSMGIIGKSSSPTYEGKYILVARVGANAGSINMVEDSFGVTDNTLVIENDSRIDTDFEYYLLKVANLNRYIFGSGQPLVTGSMLKALKVLIPSFPEQQKIASFFTAIDQKISQLKKKKILLEQYKKGVMQKIFSQEIRFKDDNGQEFPKWEKKKLGDISERMTTKNNEGNENVLTISAQHGLVGQLDFFNKSVAATDLSGYFLLKKDDFAYNKSYSAGYPMGAFKRLKLYDKGVLSTLYICFTFNSAANLSYMEQYFESGRHNREIEKIAQEGARNHGLLNVGVGDFFSTEVLLPSLGEQTKIANFLSAIDEKITHTQNQIEKAEVWKKGLMQQMFV